MRLSFLIFMWLLAGSLKAGQAPETPMTTLPKQENAAVPPVPVQIEFSQLKPLFQPPAPPYPPLAKLVGVQGTVLLKLTIGPSGVMEQVEAIEGPAMLRPTAEALMKNWLFAPMTRDGKPIRVQCTLAVPFTLPDVSNPGPLIDSVVLQMEAAPSHNFKPVDMTTLQEETTAWLAAKGLRRVDAAGADPEHTLHLRLEIQTVQAQGGTYICTVMERCSLLSDLKLTKNDPGQAQRVSFLNHVVGQKGETGFQDCLKRTFLATLQDLVLQPAPPMSKQDLEHLRAALLRPGAVGQDKSAPTDFDFSQIKIKKQPPAPPYPAAAKLHHIQGLVIVEIIIDTFGNPIHADAKEGPGELLATAISYALQWEFEPARLNGVPQTARFRLNMPFKLRDNGAVQPLRPHSVNVRPSF